MAGTLTILAAAPQGALTFAGLVPAIRLRTWLPAAIVGCLSALALVWLAGSEYPAALSRDTAPIEQAAPRLAPKQAAASVGVVESVRDVPAEAGTGAPRFETTMRMRDG